MVEKMIQLTQMEKVRLTTTEIAKRVRQELKETFPQCIFSVTKKSYSGGSSINICLTKASFNPFRKPESITTDMVHHYHLERETIESLQERQKTMYAQLNHYQLLDVWNEESWCNGSFLTKDAHEILQKAVQISNQYNYDNSDAQTDYFDVHFYLHMSIGKWDKPFEVI